MNTISFEETKKMVSNTFETNLKNILLWGGFFSVSLLVYYFISSGDFSFLLTYASFMRCFGFGILNYRMWTAKSGKGLSIKSLELYTLTFIARLLSILRHQGYLPFDKSGDWFYHFVEIFSLVLVLLALYGMFGPLLPTYDEKNDKFGNLSIPSEFGIIYIVAPCVILAVLFHPALNREAFSDTCWTLSMYLEAVAMLPQVYMFQRQASGEGGGVVEEMIGHTVFAVTFARVFELIFWLGSFKELSNVAGSHIPGYIVLVSQVAHLLMMGDFFYYYFKSITKGTPMELPPVYSNVV